MYPSYITKIHSEFNTAGEKLLTESKKILSAAVDEKARRLKRMGFNGLNEVKEFYQQEVRKNKAQILAELVEYYKQKYPFNKFVTEEIVFDICKRYKLIFGLVSDFTGFVPDRNLQAIEQFLNMDIGEKDSVLTLKISKLSFWSFNSPKPEVKIIEKYFEKTNGCISGTGEALYALEECLKEKLNLKERYLLRDWSYKKVYKPLMICASPKEMNIRKIRFMFSKPDPVVLYPVRGGYLIVTAWGDEANDPAVVNENLN